jgi:Rrf2 family protein
MQANSRFTIAIHICLFLQHENKKLVSSQEIAGSVKTNPVVIRRLIRFLREDGIIGSVAGAKGGFYLQVKPGDLTLWRIYQAIKEGDLFSKKTRNEDCPVGGNLCNVLDGVYKEAELSMEQVLGNVTIQNLHNKINSILID